MRFPLDYTPCVRTFEILEESDDSFYGAKVGERFTTKSVDEDGDLWLDPAENPCIREEFWKDMPTICILRPVEIELGLVKEIV